MTVQKKILFANIVPLVVVIAIMAVLYVNLNRIKDTLTNQQHEAEVLIKINAMHGYTQDMTDIILNLLIQREQGLPSDTLSSVKDIYKSLDALEADLKVSMIEGDEKNMIMSIFESYRAIQPIITDQLLPAVKYNADHYIIVSVGDLLNYALIDARSSLNESVDNTQNKMGNILETISARFSYFSILIIISAAVGVIIFIIMSVLLNYAVINKLKAFIITVKSFTSGEGDLRLKIPVDTKDEFGEMAGYFNAFVEQVGKIIRETKSATDDTIHTNMAVAATMEELSTTFQNQNTQVSTVASAMEEMSASSQEVKHMIDTSSTFINSMFSDTKHGVEQLKSVMQNINEIKNKTTKLSETVKGLEGSSSQIGDILSVINDIADQTNLLALNAAIEAARAGEAGRGFAVVADEVRKLAERTQRSTNEIETIIKSLQTDAASASQEMDEAGASVELGVNSITVTEGAFKKVVDSVTQVEDNFKVMSNAVVEQIAAIGGVNNSTQSIASGIEESSSVVDQVAKSTQDLENKSNNIVKILNYFKV